MGIYSITRHMNEDHAKYPPITGATKWNHSYINKILRNPATHGLLQPKKRVNGVAVPEGDPIEDYYPAVISKDLFNLVQSRSSTEGKKSVGRKGDTLTNLFMGMLTCGSCGANVGLKNKGKPPKGFKYLRCNNSIQNHECKSPSWRYEEFEGSFVQFVKEIKFSSLLGDANDEQENLEALRATALTKTGALKTSYDALLSQFENPDLPPQVLSSLISRSRELLESIETEEGITRRLDQQIARQRHEDADTDQSDFIAAYDKISGNNDPASLREIRYAMHSLLKRYIDEITIYNDFTINPWELDGNISTKLRKSMGSMTDEELETYFSKPHGQRQYAKSERYFAVKFKSGQVRVVHPYEGVTYNSVTERLAKIRDQSK